MNAEKIVFLDTSIQIERLIGSTERQAQIEQELKNSAIQFVTSWYVFMEFQRSLWADFVYVYNQMQQYQNWTDVAYHLRSGNRSYRPRSLGNCLQIFTWVLLESNLEYEKALDYLDLQISQGLMEDFWLFVKPLPDPILCDLVRIGLRPQQHGQYDLADTCRKENARCHLPTFLTEQKNNLQKIANYLAIHPRVIKDQIRLERLLATVIENPQTALGQSTCWPLGEDYVVYLRQRRYGRWIKIFNRLLKH